MTLEQRENARIQKVVKANDLIQKSRYDLSIQQQKLLLYVISHIKPEDEELLPQQFTLKELCEVCGMSQHRQNLKHIADNIKKIADTSYWIDIDGKYTLCRWFKEANIEKEKNNLITIELDNKLKPYLIQLNQFFTVYEVGYIYPMESKYSIRLYELLKSYENIGKCSFDLTELKLKLQTPEYKEYNNFKKRVIEPALEEINEYTDLQVSFKPIREGRNIKKLFFDINTKWQKEELIRTRLNGHKVLEENIKNDIE